MQIRHNKPPPAPRQQQTAQPQAGADQQQQDGQQQPEPAEAAAIRDLLKSLGIKKYDPRVVTMMMDYTWRTASDLLQEAEAVNIAAGGTGAELAPQDLALAASQLARAHPQPPSLQELHALARRVNAQPLSGPSDKQHGIKLPPVADCLLSQNYQIRQPPKPAGPQPPAPAAGPPRQHYAVKQKPGKVGFAIPQGKWDPQPDVAGAAAEPFLPPLERPLATLEGQPQQHLAPMDTDEQEQEEI